MRRVRHLFRAANVWWRCAPYLLLRLVVKCLETIDVCIWYMFVFMSVVLTVLVCGNVCCEANVNKDSGF